MRLLHPPRPFVWPSTARQIQAVGWEPHLEAAGCPEAWYRARDVLRCHICQPKYPPERRSGWGISVFGLSPLTPPDNFTPKIGQTPDPPSAWDRLDITPPALTGLGSCASGPTSPRSQNASLSPGFRPFRSVTTPSTSSSLPCRFLSTWSLSPAVLAFGSTWALGAPVGALLCSDRYPNLSWLLC